HTNLCPVGITSHLPHLEAGVVVQEKRFRTANYLRTMREGLFMLGASCGIDSPSKFDKRHIAIRESNNDVNKVKEFVHAEQPMLVAAQMDTDGRSEERRVGKGRRTGRSRADARIRKKERRGA